jgi:hypothetical protein
MALKQKLSYIRDVNNFDLPAALAEAVNRGLITHNQIS